MVRRVWTVLTLTLAAATLAAGMAHVLEAPAKARFDDDFYSAVNGSLYWGFAAIGAPVMVGAVLAATALCRVERGRRRFRMTAAGAALLWASLGMWAALVYPVNAEIARQWQSAAAPDMRRPPANVVATWSTLRSRWEGGHAASFALALAGFVALAWAATTPDAAPPSAR